MAKYFSHVTQIDCKVVQSMVEDFSLGFEAKT